jgi:hypothetical protein
MNRPIRVHLPQRITPSLRRPVPSKPVKCFALSPTQETIYWVGHSVTLFVGFYCGLQWLHYRETRQQIEQQQKSEDLPSKKDPPKE